MLDYIIYLCVIIACLRFRKTFVSVLNDTEPRQTANRTRISLLHMCFVSDPVTGKWNNCELPPRGWACKPSAVNINENLRASLWIKLQIKSSLLTHYGLTSKKKKKKRPSAEECQWDCKVNFHLSLSIQMLLVISVSLVNFIGGLNKATMWAALCLMIETRAKDECKWSEDFMCLRARQALPLQEYLKSCLSHVSMRCSARAAVMF